MRIAFYIIPMVNGRKSKGVIDEGDGNGTDKGIDCCSLLQEEDPIGARLPNAKTILKAKIYYKNKRKLPKEL